METIKIENLKEWLVDYITKSIHESRAKSVLAQNFDRKTAEIIVNSEFFNDFGYIDCEEISVEDAKNYAQSFIDRIL